MADENAPDTAKAHLFTEKRSYLRPSRFQGVFFLQIKEKSLSESYGRLLGRLCSDARLTGMPTEIDVQVWAY